MTDENNSFNSCVEYEKSQTKSADDWYSKSFALMSPIIYRPGFETKEDRALQKSNVDVQLHLTDPDNDENYTMNISEKFRSKDWGDIWIELYDNYATRSKGNYTEKNQADSLVYFTPEFVYSMPKMQELVNFAEQCRQNPSIQEAIVKLSHLRKTNRIGLQLLPTVKEYKDMVNVSLIKNSGLAKNNKYTLTNYGLLIKWEDLEKFGINYLKFNRE